ncbi:MAG: tyrosine-type recombinase/integrase [Pirellulaceae bacterium]
MAKPTKPHPDFPLTPHATGQWCRRYHGKLRYFGTDPDIALERWKSLCQGRPTGGLGLQDGLNIALTSATTRLASRTVQDYTVVAKELIAFWGPSKRMDEVTPADFEELAQLWAKQGHGAYTLASKIRRTKALFGYLARTSYITARNYGPGFVIHVRSLRLAQRDRTLTAPEIRQLVKAASPTMKALILLGLSCGLGPTDLALMPPEAVDLERGWLNYARRKTGIKRRAKLWPEIVTLIGEVGHAPLLFRTSKGNPWSVEDKTISKTFANLRKRLEMRPVSFYGLRHTFQNAAEEVSDDPLAVRAIMGHTNRDVSANYRNIPSDKRLFKVAKLLRTWYYTAK